MDQNRRKEIIISGGTKGLGRELSIQFDANGYRVISLFSHDLEAASTLAKVFKDKGSKSECIQSDITNPIQIKLSEGSEIIAIHNACATFSPMQINCTKWSSFQEQYEVAVHGAYNLLHGSLKHMAKMKRGNFITVLSHGLIEPMPKGFTPYLCAKAALQIFTKNIALEYNKLGIKTFSVSPGYMNTELTRKWPEIVRQSVATGDTNNDPKEVAKKIIDIILNPTTPGSGEDYQV